MTASAAATVRVMSPEEIAARAGGETPRLHWPERGHLFAEREMRLRQLAPGHPMGDYLRFMADVAHAQQARLNAFPTEHPSVPLPDGGALSAAALAGLPPLSAVDWPRDAAWQAVLRRLATELRECVPTPARPALEQLASADHTTLERQADAILHGLVPEAGLAIAPIVAAALQVYWSHLLLETQRLHAAASARGPNSLFGQLDDPTVCPCCGSKPTASITRSAGESLGQRYLHCSLCSLQWHMVRIQCSHCLSGKALAYQSLDTIGAEAGDEAADGAASRAAQAVIQAETCDDCGHYLKIMHSDRDAFVEPVADDLASLTLDLLVSETGQQRHGVNLMLFFGDPDANTSDPSPPPDPAGA